MTRKLFLFVNRLDRVPNVGVFRYESSDTTDRLAPGRRGAGGRDGYFGGLSPFGGDGPSYTDWLYAPHEFSSSDRYPIVMFEPAAIDEHRSQLSDSLRELLASAEETLSPVYFETVDSVLLMDRSYVIQGEYTRSDVVSTLTQIGYVEHVQGIRDIHPQLGLSRGR